MIAQVDEQHAAMIAHAMHPARQARLGALVRLAQITACMASVGVHNPSQIGSENRKSARKSACGGPIVKLWRCSPDFRGFGAFIGPLSAANGPY